MYKNRKIILSGSLFCFSLFFFTLSPSLIFASSNVVINEFLANPPSGGNEWVELYNPTSSDVNLTGWVLSDKSNSKKNLDSLGNISANSFAVYEYSGDGWLNNSASQSKPESISLLDNNGSTVDSFSYYSDQKENITTGRSPDGSDNWSVLVQSTKGSSNGTAPETPTPTQSLTPSPTKIPTPIPTVKQTLTSKPTAAKTQVAISEVQTTEALVSVISFTNSPVGFSDTQDISDNAISSNPTQVLGAQSSTASIAAKKIKSSKSKNTNNSISPKVLIAFGLSALCVCGILAFFGYKKWKHEKIE